MGKYLKASFPSFLYYVNEGDYLYGPYLKKPNNGVNYTKFSLIECFDELDKTIGVICLNGFDFQNWRVENGLIPDGINNKTLFSVGNTKYIAIIGEYSIIGRMVDSYVETSNAKNKINYEKIISLCKLALKRSEK